MAVFPDSFFPTRQVMSSIRNRPPSWMSLKCLTCAARRRIRPTSLPGSRDPAPPPCAQGAPHPSSARGPAPLSVRCVAPDLRSPERNRPERLTPFPVEDLPGPRGNWRLKTATGACRWSCQARGRDVTWRAMSGRERGGGRRQTASGTRLVNGSLSLSLRPNEDPPSCRRHPRRPPRPASGPAPAHRSCPRAWRPRLPSPSQHRVPHWRATRYSSRARRRPTPPPTGGTVVRFSPPWSADRFSLFPFRFRS